MNEFSYEILQFGLVCSTWVMMTIMFFRSVKK